jgi:hypothetical protein
MAKECTHPQLMRDGTRENMIPSNRIGIFIEMS